MLRFCADVSPADWITRSRDATDDVASGQAWKALALFGPPEFEAYARVRFRPDPHWAGIGADTTTIRTLTTRDDIDVVTADRYGRQPFYD